jgi:hypothetical protein
MKNLKDWVQDVVTEINSVHKAKLEIRQTPNQETVIVCNSSIDTFIIMNRLRYTSMKFYVIPVEGNEVYHIIITARICDDLD